MDARGGRLLRAGRGVARAREKLSWRAPIDRPDALTNRDSPEGAEAMASKLMEAF